MTKNIDSITLRLMDFDCAPQAVTEELNLIPTRIGVKGEKCYDDPSNKSEFRIWDYNYWEIKINRDPDEHFTSHIEKLTHEIIVPRLEKLRKFGDECIIEVAIAEYYKSNFTHGFGINNNILKIISDIGADLEVYHFAC